MGISFPFDTLGCLLIERGRRDGGRLVDILTFEGMVVWSTGDGGTIEEAIADWLADGVPTIDMRGEVH